MNIADMSITKIREYCSNLDQLTAEFIQLLLADSRKGVVEIGHRVQSQLARREQLANQWHEMSKYEQQLREQGNSLIVGIDEVGRGPLAGPVVAAAVALPTDFFLPGLNDSKKVPAVMREAFYDVIQRDAIAVGIGVVSSERIDQINILQATFEAMRIALDQLGQTPDACLVDAVRIPGITCRQFPIIGGDGKSVSIAAASIIAKVTRDRMMSKYAEEYPQYGFDKNVGYGTAEHLQALHTYGPCPLHRRSFGQVASQGTST